MDLLHTVLAAELRRQWRAWLGLALAAGIVCGVVVAVAEGAHRAQTTVSRYRAATANEDVEVNWIPLFGGPKIDITAAMKLPQVAAAGEVEELLPLGLVTGSGQVSRVTDFTLLAPTSRAYGRLVDRPLLLQGRAPRPDAPDEVVVDSRMAADLDLRAGSIVGIRMMTPGQERLLLAGNLEPLTRIDPARAHGKLVEVHVVGIEAWIDQAADQDNGEMIASPAFLGAHMRGRPVPGYLAAVRLDHGADGYASFAAAVSHLYPRSAVVYTSSSAVDAAPVTHTIELETELAWLALAFTAATACAIVAPLFYRRARQGVGDQYVLRAIGMPPGQRFALSLAGTIAIAIAAAAVAAIFALLVSPFTSLGDPGAYDPASGFWFDPWALLAGAASIIAVAICAGAYGARGTRDSGRPALNRTRIGPGSRSAMLRFPSGPIPVVLGLRAALLRADGATGAAVVAALVAATVSMLSLSLGLVLSASMNKLITTPPLYGGDAQITATVGGTPASVVRSALRAARDDPTILAASAIALDQVTIDGQEVNLMGTRAVRGRGIRIAITDGRMPRAHEVAFATPTLRELHLHVGDLVKVRFAHRQVSLKVTGSAVLPTEAWSSGDVGLGGGGVLALRTLRSLDPGATVTRIPVRVSPGSSISGAIRRLERETVAAWSPQPQPSEIVKIAKVRSVPLLLTVTLALGALLVVAHHLAASGRRRRNELAILRTLGLTPRDSSLVVVVQAAAWLLVGAAIGIPAGILAGSRLWDSLAGRLGVVAAPVAPTAMVLLVPAIVVGCIAISIGPAVAAARTPVAEALRAE
jgi:hypothetical protein